MTSLFRYSQGLRIMIFMVELTEQAENDLKSIY